MSVTVHLDDFDSEEILEGAYEIIRGGLKSASSEKNEYWARRCKRERDIIEKIRLLFRAPGNDVLADPSLPPPSTAAKIKSAEHLREVLAKNEGRLTVELTS